VSPEFSPEFSSVPGILPELAELELRWKIEGKKKKGS
jgi:hypothetical protein